jgi:O-antigen/teichoic acid export membrane protein
MGNLPMRGGRVAAGVLWTAVAAWGREAVNLGITLVLARWLGPEAYGAVGMAGVVVMLGQLLIGRGLREALIQRKDLSRAQLDTAFWLFCVLGISATIASLALAGPLATFFDAPEVADLARALSPLPTLTALSTFQLALLTRELRFASLTLRSLCSVLAGGTVGLAMAYNGGGASSLVGLLLAQAIAEAAVLWLLNPWRPGFQVSRAAIRDLGEFSLWLIGNSAVGFADQQILRAFVGYMYGSAILGFYVLSWRMFEVVLSVFITPISNTGLLAFARAQDDPQRLREIFLSVTSLVVLIALPAFSGCLILAPDAVPFLLGPRWSEGAIIFQVLCVFAITDSVLHAYDALLTGTGRASWIFAISGACVPILIVLLLIFGSWGVASAALIFLARNISIVPLYFRAMRDIVRNVHQTEFGRYARILAATFVMLAAVAWWRSSIKLVPMVGVVFSCAAVGVVTYLATSFLLARPLLLEAYRLVRLGGASIRRFE